MNKEWVQRKNEESRRKYETNREALLKEIQTADYISEEKRAELMNAFYEEEYFLIPMKYRFITMDLRLEHVKQKKHSDAELKQLEMRVDQIIDIAESIDRYKKNPNPYDRYLDSEPMEFDGDIIITDPCYIMRAEHHGTIPIFEDDWEASEYGFNMEKLGINNYITRSTLYGDWSCTVYDTDTGDPIGEFCADAGLVSVINLHEVLKYNPDFDYHINKPWTTTLIKNFIGTIQFVVEGESGIYTKKDEYEFNGRIYNKEGTFWENFYVKVVGHGVNKETGEPINFEGFQTGL